MEFLWLKVNWMDGIHVRRMVFMESLNCLKRGEENYVKKIKRVLKLCPILFFNGKI